MKCGSVIPAHTKNQQKMKPGVRAKRKATIRTGLKRLRLRSRFSIPLRPLPPLCHPTLSTWPRNRKRDPPRPITRRRAKKRPARPAVRKWIGTRRKAPGGAPSADTREAFKEENDSGRSRKERENL